MTTQLPSKERLEQIANFHSSMALPPSHDEIEVMARALLAAYEQEPVFFVDIEGDDWVQSGRIPGVDLGQLPNGRNNLYTHPAPSIHIDENSDFIKHIRKCSEEVSKWPEWKRNAADAMSAIAAPSIPAVPTFEEWCASTNQKPLGWVGDAMKEAYEGCCAAMLNGGKS